MMNYKQAWLNELDSILSKNISNSALKIPDLAKEMNLSERTFRNRLLKYSGLRPTEYVIQVRLKMAYKYLSLGYFPTVGQVSDAVGIKSQTYFTKEFKAMFNVLPSSFLR